jgi:hypothetical protein
MAVTVGNITKYIGAGNIYTGCTRPADAAPLVHTAGVPAGGTDVGATQGAATLVMHSNIALVDIEQVYGGVAPHMTTEDASLQFTALEATYANLQLALQQGTGSTSGGVNLIKFGGKTAVTTTCVAVSSARTDVPTKYVIGMLYQGASMDGVTLPFQRGTERKLQIKFSGIPDPTYLAGNQMGQYYEDV